MPRQKAPHSFPQFLTGLPEPSGPHNGVLGDFRALPMLLLIGSSCLAASAQSTFAGVRGTVADPTGAAVPGSTITLHSVDENTDRVVTADIDGAFVFSNIKPGHFVLHATGQGFSPTDLSGIVLEARQDLRLPVVLSVAAQTTTVEVDAAADVINTESATIGDSKNNVQITQLPLNNRAVTTSPLGALSLSPNVQQDSQGNLSLDGASASQVNFSVDGISTANVRQNGPLNDAYPSQEGISAVKVTAFNNSAEFSQVGDVTFVTKGGSNKYHGSLFEYFQNDLFNASPYGFSSKAPLNYNTFGGSVSGPVSIPHIYRGRDRTFFFADYEGNRRTFSASEQYVVPSGSDRSGNLTDIGGPANVPFSINPTASALLNTYYPLPNIPGASGVGVPNYQTFVATPAATDGADLRIDQSIGSKQSIYARFSRKNVSQQVVNSLLPNDVASVHNRSLLVSYNYTFTPRLLNEFRFGLTNATTGVNFPLSGAASLQELDLQNVNISQHPLTHAFPTFNFNAGTGFQTIGRDKAGITQSKTYEFTDNLTYTLGKHTFKGGADIRRVRYFDLESFAPAFASDDFGSFTFTQNFATGNSFEDFLKGAPNTLYFAVSSPDVGGAALQSSFFLQDEWQLTNKLTLSYGLRYQLLPPFIEDGGNLANFDQKSNAIVVPDNLAPYLAQQKLQSSNLGFQKSFNACGLNPANGMLPCTRYLTATEDGRPQGLRQTYKGNVQPRISFAYRPFSDGRTVVRGGFGVFTITNLGPLSFNNSGNPTSALHAYNNSLTVTGQPLIQFPNTAPPSSGVQYGGGSLDQGVDPKYRDPQANQYSLTVERELTSNTSLRTSFVGMYTYRLSTTEDLNQIPASTIAYNSVAAGTAGIDFGTGPYVDRRAPYANWSELYSTLNHGEANYNALQVEATHRMVHGLYYDANYTFAKNLADNQGDNPSSFASEVAYGFPLADRFNTRSAYGNVEGTRRNRFLLTGIVQSPFGQGRKYLNKSNWVSAVVGGWDLNTVMLLESGPWLTPSISPALDQSNTNLQARGGFARPDQVSTNFAVGRSRNAYFNVNAFQPTPAGAGRFGNASVGVLEGPGTRTVALGVAKNFRITESSHIRFESTFTNVFNHTNFAPPSTQVIVDGSGNVVTTNSGFGVLTAATTAEGAGNRTGQFALRFDF